MADLEPLDTISFAPWIDPVIDAWGIDPASPYSRSGWLPIIGPSAWLIWGTLSRQLKHEQPVTWRLKDLAHAHGLGPRISRTSPIVRTLVRLEQFAMARPVAAGELLVRMTAPPLTRRQLARLPEYVAQLHNEVFNTKPTGWAQAD